jgi:hypothetical protein
MSNPVDAGNNTQRFSISVPTSTVIAVDPGDPFKVCVIEQVKKHNRRLTLVGGRVELPGQNFLDCALAEWDQEAGGAGAILVNPVLWAVKTDPQADVRDSTLGKLTHETCEQGLRAVPVRGHYGVPDCLYVAPVLGTPAPKDGEAKSCFFFDIRDLDVTETSEQSRFGANHDLILEVYRLHLLGRPVQPDDFADSRRLRELVRAQRMAGTAVAETVTTLTSALTLGSR